jgi:diadenosine tetraphosphatase ApaH/serine/threonine PP2A family protein phosphatase
LIGNHDQAALDLIPLSRFNRDAGEVAAWTQQTLTEENKDYLRSLASKISLDQFTLAHGSPNQPVWEYILDTHSADRSFAAFKTDYCLVGHSHLPLIFYRPPESNFTAKKYIEWNQAMELLPRMILNPGSVGQPRDRDPRASFAMLDINTNTWEMKRADYDIHQVQQRILDASLPERQALRLAAGW